RSKAQFVPRTRCRLTRRCSGLASLAAELHIVRQPKETSPHAYAILPATLYLAFVAPSATDGIPARQGQRSEAIDAVEQTVFSSPLILEMAFPSAALRASPREVPPPGVITRYSCDGVSILSLAMKGPQHDEPGTKVHFRYVVRVAKGQDKLVS